eukprot:6068258-Amphidinium_carterae.1
MLHVCSLFVCQLWPDVAKAFCVACSISCPELSFEFLLCRGIHDVRHGHTSAAYPQSGYEWMPSAPLRVSASNGQGMVHYFIARRALIIACETSIGM